MALRFEDKKTIVSEVLDIAGTALSAVAAEYTGLTVAEMTELRAQARSKNVLVRVVPNNLAKRALEGTEFDCMRDDLVGPLVLAFAKEDPGASARLFRDFSKDHEKLVIKILSVGGQLLQASELDKLAILPTRDEAIAQIMSVMLAPITQFVRTLAEPHSRLVRVFGTIRDQKQASE